MVLGLVFCPSALSHPTGDASIFNKKKRAAMRTDEGE